MGLLSKQLKTEKIEKILNGLLNKKNGWGFQSRIKADGVDFTCSKLFVSPFKRDVWVNIHVTVTGVLFFNVSLGKITPTPEVLKILNTYNSEMQGIMNVSVDGENELWVNRIMTHLSYRDLKKDVNSTLNTFLSDDAVAYIKKLLPAVKPC